MRIDWDHKFLRLASGGMLLAGGLLFGASLVLIVFNLFFGEPIYLTSEKMKWTSRFFGWAFLAIVAAITVLLTYSAVTVFKRKTSNVLFMSVGLTVGLPVAMITSHVVLTWNSILWELAPDFMKEAMLSTFMNNGVVLLVMAAWFAMPIARAARLSTSSPTNA